MFHIVGRSPEGEISQFLMINDYTLQKIYEEEDASINNYEKRIYSAYEDEECRLNLKTVDIREIGYFNEDNRYVLVCIKEISAGNRQYILCNSRGDIYSIPVGDTSTLENFFLAIKEGGILLVNGFMRKYKTQGYRFYMYNGIDLPFVKLKRSNPFPENYKSYVNVAYQPEDVFVTTEADKETGEKESKSSLEDLFSIFDDDDDLDLDYDVNSIKIAENVEIKQGVEKKFDIKFIRDGIKNGATLRSFAKYYDVNVTDIISAIETNGIDVDLHFVKIIVDNYKNGVGLLNIGNQLGLDLQDTMRTLAVAGIDVNMSDKEVRMMEILKDIQIDTSISEVIKYYNISTEEYQQITIRLFDSDMSKEEIKTILSR